MLRLGKAVVRSQTRDPVLEAALAQFDDAVTLAAYKVMVMGIAAEAIAQLAAMMAQGVYDSVLA